MTREEAIRILDPVTTGEVISEIEYYGGFSGRTAAVQAVSDACILAVAALREQEQRRWIPVTERLPVSDGFYIVVMSGDIWGEPDVWISTACGFYNGKWDEDGAMISHWMPLPEPPKEDAR